MFCTRGKANWSEMFYDIDEAAAYAERMSIDKDVYFSLGLMDEVQHGRGKADDVKTLTCVWADVDVAHAVHQKTNLPPSLDEARRLIEKTGLAPTLVINSGHGLQAYWLFKEPWHLSTDDERAAAKVFTRRWQRTLTAAARSMGYEIDSVHDLARVLRVPGTVNRKADPVPVSIIENTQETYDRLTDIEPRMVADEQVTQSDIVTVGVLKLDMNVDRPAIVSGMIANGDDRLEATMNMTRKDMKDQSPSSYDQSIADQLVLAGCTDQDIADAIIYFRRSKNLNANKCLRVDYMQGTIANARRAMAKHIAVESIGEMATRTADRELTTSERDQCIEDIGTVLGFRIKNLVQYGTDESTYSIVPENGDEFTIGSVAAFRDARQFANRVYEVKKISVAMKPKKWMNILGMAGKVIETRDARSTGLMARMYEWMKDYIAHGVVVDRLTDGYREPIVYHGRYYVLIHCLMQFIDRRSGPDRILEKQVKPCLLMMKFKKSKMDIMREVSGKTVRTSRSCYAIDVELWNQVIEEREMSDGSDSGVEGGGADGDQCGTSISQGEQCGVV